LLKEQVGSRKEDGLKVDRGDKREKPSSRDAIQKSLRRQGGIRPKRRRSSLNLKPANGGAIVDYAQKRNRSGWLSQSKSLASGGRQNEDGRSARSYETDGEKWTEFYKKEAGGNENLLYWKRDPSLGPQKGGGSRTGSSTDQNPKEGKGIQKFSKHTSLKSEIKRRSNQQRIMRKGRWGCNAGRKKG